MLFIVLFSLVLLYSNAYSSGTAIPEQHTVFYENSSAIHIFRPFQGGVFSDSTMSLPLAGKEYLRRIDVIWQGCTIHSEENIGLQNINPAIRQYRNTTTEQQFRTVIPQLRSKHSASLIKGTSQGVALTLTQPKQFIHLKGTEHSQRIMLTDKSLVMLFPEGRLEFLLTNGTMLMTVTKEGYTLELQPTPTFSSFEIRVNWASYFGGSRDENTPDGGSISSDSQGNLYLAGWTLSNDMIPPTPGRFTYSGNVDAFLASLTPDGITRWATYFGGRGNDYFFDVAADSSGNTIVAGTVIGSDPIPVSYGRAIPLGNSDAMFAKFRDDGRLWDAALLGGSSTDSAMTVAWLPDGGFVLGGITRSNDLPIRSGSPTYRGEGDMFVALFNATARPQWFSYFGSSALDICRDIAVITRQGTPEIYLTGDAGAPDFPSPNAHSGGSDIAILRLQTDGTMLWSSRIGGASADIGRAIAVTNDGSIFVAGETASSDFPVSENGTAYQGQRDGCVFHIAANGTVVWSTCLGGTQRELCSGISYDNRGYVYVVGATLSTPQQGFPITSDALFPEHKGDFDGYIAQFDANGNRSWGTYYGGNGDDAFSAVTVSRQGKIYLTGRTSSTDFPTLNAQQPLPGSADRIQYDAFVVAINPCEAPLPQIVADGPTEFCNGGTVTLSVNNIYPRYRWSNGATTSSITVSRSGNFSVTVSNNRGCQLLSTATSVRIFSDPPPLSLVATGNSIAVQSQVQNALFRWEYQGTTLATQERQIPIQGAGLYDVVLIDTNGCSTTASMYISETFYTFDSVVTSSFSPEAPLILRRIGSAFTEEVPTDTLYGTIRCNATVFYPTAVTGVFASTIEVTAGTIFINFTAPVNTDTITIIGKPLLGNIQRSPLLAELRFDNPAALAQINTSSFALQDICTEGGQRLISYPDVTVSLRGATAIPSGIAVEMTIPTQETVLAECFTVTGNKVFTDKIAPSSSGLLAFTVNNLSRGSYILRLQLGAWQYSTLIFVNE